MNITDLADGDATAAYLCGELTHDLAPTALDDARALVADALAFAHPPAGAHVVAGRLAERDGDYDALERSTAAALRIDPGFGPALEDHEYLALLRAGPGRRAGVRRRALHLFEKVDWFSGRAAPTARQIDFGAAALDIEDPYAHGREVLRIAESGLFLAFLAFEAGLLRDFETCCGDRLPPSERALARSWFDVRHRRLRLDSTSGAEATLADIDTDEVLRVDAPWSLCAWSVGETAFALVVPVGDRRVLLGEPMVIDDAHRELADRAVERLAVDPLAVAHLCLRWLYVEQLHVEADGYADRVRFVFPDADPSDLDVGELALLDLVRARHPERARRADDGDAQAEADLLMEAIVASRIITLRTPHTWAMAERLLAMGGSRESVLEAVTHATYAELWHRAQEEAA